MKYNLRIATILATGLLAVAFFFRLSVLSGFEYVPGDVWDGRLLFGIVDHWRQFFSGQCAWNDLRIFWPMPNTLAYSDTFFIEGVPYAVLCALGVDQFVSYTLVFMAQAYVGYLSMYWLLKRFFKVRWYLAAAFAAIFVNIASMQLSIDSSHLQMTIAWLCPLFVAMLWKALEGGKRDMLWAAGAAVLLSAMFLTAYYMTWFMVFFLCIVAVLWLASRLILRGENATGGFVGKCRALVSWLVEKRKPIAAFAVAFALSIIPFLMLYLPAIHEFGERKFKGILSTLPGPIDFIDVGERNLLWGWFCRMYGLDGRPYGGELNFGVPPLTLVLFFAAFVFFLVIALRKKRMANEERVVFIAGCAVLVSWILLFRYHEDSAWYFVLKCVPGAGAMRAIFRMNLFVASVALVVSAVFVNRLAERKQRAFIVLAALLPLVVFIEQYTAPRTDSRIKRSAERAAMAMIPPPPADARIFFVVPDFKNGSADMVQEHMTALLVAGRYNLSTINGHTGQLPSGWNLDIEGERYFRNAAQWLNDHGSPTGVYGLDAVRGKWLSPDFIADPVAYATGTEVVDGRIFDSYAWVGWSGVEPWGVWSDGKHAEFRFLMSGDGDLVIKIAFHSYNPGHRKQHVTMFVNKREVGKWTLAEGDHLKEEIRVAASEIKEGRLFVGFDLPDAVSPQSVGDCQDPRVLGIGLDSFVIVPSKKAERP
jgi:hypothetical protein